LKPFFQVLHTYQSAREVIKAFAMPKGLNFVVMLGPPGVGKTTTFFGTHCPDCVLFQGGLSPVKLYCELYLHRDKPVVFDDTDELFDIRAGINLLKCLGQTDEVKHLMWRKASPVLREEGVPTCFQTTSRVLIFANTLRTIEDNLGAVLDRAHVYKFAPSPSELHREVRKWFRDDEIYGFVGQNLAQIETLSMRDYVKAKELKVAGLDWREMLLNKWHEDPKLTVMLRLVGNKNLSPTDRQLEFAKLGHGAEATYKRYLSKANKITKVIGK
jgi:hypothetical protein